MSNPASPSSESARSIFVRLWWRIYLPFVFAGLGRGMLIPILPLYLRAEGLSYREVAVVIAAIGVGAVAAGIPVGSVAAKVGPQRLFILATLTVSLTAALVGLTAAVLVLVLLRFVFGVGNVGLRVALQTIVRAETDVGTRGRAMAMVGGMRRVSVFVGPLVGGVLADSFGFTIAFAVAGALSAVGLVPFVMTLPPGAITARPQRANAAMRRVLGQYRGLLLLAGVGQMLVLTVREGREVVVPLIGDDIGLSASVIGAMVAIGTGADLALFPVAGWLSDRFGRLYAIVPAFTVLGIGLFVLAWWPTTGGMLVAVTVMGIGNGLSAGTLLTMGADIAPDDPGPFLAALGMMGDLGLVIAPLLVGWLAATAGLAASAFTLGVVMFVGIAWLIIGLGDTAAPRRPWLQHRLRATASTSVES